MQSESFFKNENEYFNIQIKNKKIQPYIISKYIQTQELEPPNPLLFKEEWK